MEGVTTPAAFQPIDRTRIEREAHELRVGLQFAEGALEELRIAIRALLGRVRDLELAAGRSDA